MVPVNLATLSGGSGLVSHGIRASRSGGCCATPPIFSGACDLARPKKKQKHLQRADLETLDAALARSRQEYASIARLWLWVGVLTGLRPNEWAHTTWVPDGPSLVVRNAKHTNGRGNGPERTLHLRTLLPAEQEAIHSMVDLAAATPDFAALYARIRKNIYRVAKRCFPRRTHIPSLYSARHQWAANAKKVYTKREVAALAGHASAETAGIHYARRRYGEAGHLPLPDEQDVERVQVSAKPVWPPHSSRKPTGDDRKKSDSDLP